MIPVDTKINQSLHSKSRRTAGRSWGGKKEEKYYVGIDGEGRDFKVGKDGTREDHRYTLLAWSDADGIESGYVENDNGLSTVECFDFLLTIPNRAKSFAYAFNYDLTKMFTDVDNESLFKLFRPELRKRPASSQKFGPFPVPWTPPPYDGQTEEHPGYLLNLQGTKFTIECPVSKRRRVIWDVFKFFQSKFTAALIDWKVATEEELTFMSEMKAKRSGDDWQNQSKDEVRRYCLDECAKMAVLAKSLVDAHDDVGLKLKTFYGAGSTGGAILKKWNIDKEKRVSVPEMHEAIACGFFGGRFENSVIGEVEGPLWSYDISSAYPYETTFLPCLQCGRWELTQKRSDLARARVALVHYGLGTAPPGLSWGPFPFRMRNGSICYPVESGGGWVWDREYLEGERIFPHVEFKEAWIYVPRLAGSGEVCRHKPFRSVPEYYLQRLKIGKEGKGIVIKLGINSVYGKLAQSLGDAPPFQCWIWAGIITSGTRAQILRALSLLKDPANLLMVATDGICSRERLVLPEPVETNTGILLNCCDKFETCEHEIKKIRKPLGGWEEKEVKKGVFFVRPGIYFPLNPTQKELKTVRARGVGRAVMYNAWRLLVEAFESGQDKISLAEVERFCGAKSSISVSRQPGVPLDETLITDGEVGGIMFRGKHVAWDKLQFTRSFQFGEWIKRPVDLTFNPEPKREKEFGDYVKQGSSTRVLNVRKFPLDVASTPYNRSLESQEALMLKMLNEEMLEQPDGADYCEVTDPSADGVAVFDE